MGWDLRGKRRRDIELYEQGTNMDERSSGGPLQAGGPGTF